MQDDGHAWPSPDRETLIRSAIGSWRDSLINLTGANRLLNFKPSRTGMIGLIRPSAGDVLSRLSMGGTYTFRSLKPNPVEPVPGADAQSGQTDGQGEPTPGEAHGFCRQR